MAVLQYGVTAAEMTDAWMLGGTAFQVPPHEPCP